MEQKSVKKNSVFNILTKVLGMLFPMITFPYASRILLPDGLGKINFANSVIDIFVLFAGLGIGSYAIREASKIRDDKERLSKFATEVIVINLATMAISLAVFAVALMFSQKLQDYKALLLLASARILLSTLGLEWLIVSQEEFKYIARRTFAFQLISLAFLFAFVRSPKDINKYMIFTVLSAAGANVCNFFYARKFFNFTFAQGFEIKKHLRPIFALSASVLAASVYTILDKTMIGIMRTDAEVGYYAAATKIGRLFYADTYGGCRSFAPPPFLLHGKRQGKIQVAFEQRLKHFAGAFNPYGGGACPFGAAGHPSFLRKELRERDNMHADS